MKILFLTPQIPFPPDQGAALRNYYILKGVSSRHTIDLLTFHPPDQPAAEPGLTPLISLLDRFETVPMPERSTAKRLSDLCFSPLPDMGHRLASARFEEKLQALISSKEYDIIQVEGIEMARYISTIRAYAPDSAILFDNHNAEADLQRRIAHRDFRSLSPVRWLKAAYSTIQTLKLSRFERSICNTVDQVTAVSETDANLLNHFLTADRPQAISIPNAIDLHKWQAPDTAIGSAAPHFDLLFIGKMDYRPNVDAMLWFVKSIWPAIQAAHPNCTLGIVGKSPAEQIAQLDKLPNISVTGFVPDVYPYLSRATILVMPIRMGSGTRLKMAQALAIGKPIVSTTIGAEGFPAIDRHHLLLADSAADFAEATIALLSDPAQQAELGANGQKLAEAYDYRVVVPAFLTLYDHLTAHIHKPGAG